MVPTSGTALVYGVCATTYLTMYPLYKGYEMVAVSQPGTIRRPGLFNAMSTVRLVPVLGCLPHSHATQALV